MVLVEVLLLAILCFFLVTTVISHIETWRYFARRRNVELSRISFPPISIVKPIRGLDPEAEENFLSFIRAAYPAPFEVIFSIEERDDPVVPVLRRLLADPENQSRSRLVFSRRQDRREIGKTINLMAGAKESRHDILVLSDSDVRNTIGFLEELVFPLLEPSVGMVYACPAYKGAEDWAAALTALTVNETVLALTAKPSSSTIGSAIAIRKDVLRAVGGLSPMRHRIGIDAALGRAVNSKGYRIELAREPVTIIQRHGTFNAWWERTHRWLVTIRRHIGPRYLLIPLTGFPIPWATLYLLFSLYAGNLLHGLGVWSAIGFVRLGSFSLVNWLFVKEPRLWRYLWLIPVLDFLKIPLWLQGYWDPRIVWRGRNYRVMPDATVRPEP